MVISVIVNLMAADKVDQALFQLAGASCG